MNKTLCVCVGFAAGAAIGSVATYYYTKDKFESEANEAINDYRDSANKRIKAAEERIREIEEENDEDSTDISKDDNQDSNPNPEDVDYTKFYDEDSEVKSSNALVDEVNRLTDEIAEDDDEDTSTTYDETIEFAAKIANKQQEAIDENRKPYPISARQIEDECGWYSKLTYSYFKNDDIVADEWDEALDSDDALRLVGTEFKHLFGINKEDPEEVYIRNDQNTTDYEICLDKRNYADVYNARHHHDGAVTHNIFNEEDPEKVYIRNDQNTTDYETHNIFDDYPSTDVDDESDDDSDEDNGPILSLSSD
jgi:vacuolar-type H+-ATPase subunit H